MRNTNGITVLTFLLVLGIASACVQMVSSSPAQIIDPCEGYAICR